jgi:transposase-like protein
MDGRVKRFRDAVARSGAGAVGRRYPAELRALAAALARERREEPLARVAADLGVSAVSLQRWLEQGEPVGFRPVEIEPGPATVPARGLALITPRGYRVEGLEAGVLVSLLRVLE